MTCDRVEAQLSALIDNELNPKTSAELNRHLEACPSCARTYREMKAMVSASAELEPLAPPDRLFPEILRTARNLQPRPKFAPRQIGWVLVPALATAVLMLVLFPRNPAPNPTIAQPKAAPSLAATGPVARETLPVVAARPTPKSRPSAPKAGVYSEASTAVATIPAARAPVMLVTAEQPLEPVVEGESPAASSLREVRQALEEIEAAMYRNPGNPQVQRAYQATYRKGLELRDRYLLGAR
jgi:hypothetical protein